jgi:hypothetical protein
LSAVISQYVSPQERLLALIAPACRGQCAAIDQFRPTEYIYALGLWGLRGGFQQKAAAIFSAKPD